MKRVFYALVFCAALLLISTTVFAVETNNNADSIEYYTFAEIFPDANFREYVTDTVLADSTDSKANDAALTAEQLDRISTYSWVIYLQSFAPDMDLQEFEERVCCVMENRMLVDVIDRALLRLKRYPDRGELYYEILTKQFIHRFNSTEKELLDELNMERSVFYDRKREAIFLLSLCLFGYAVPELQEELEMPRLYPD